MTTPRYSQGVERGLAVLASFRAQQRVRGIADIADELGFHHSTTHRYASTLLALGYLQQGPSRKYQVAQRAADLGMAALAATELRGGTREHLERLRTRCGLSVSLAVLHDGEVLLVDHARGFRAGQFAIDDGMAPGSRLPAACTALGKLLLAFHPDRERILGQLTLKRTGPRAITSKKLLRSELARAREDEVTIGDQELAASVIQQLLKEHTEDLLACAAAISSKLSVKTSPTIR